MSRAISKTDKNYYVVGGQYEPYPYGGTMTLQGAKQLATKNAEHWDNWQGWHVPAIYAAADMEPHECTGQFHEYGMMGTVMLPKEEARPVAVKVGKKWYNKSDVTAALANEM